MFPIRRSQQEQRSKQNERNYLKNTSTNPNGTVGGSSAQYTSNRNVILRGTHVVPTVPVVTNSDATTSSTGMNENTISDETFHRQVEYLIPATVRMISGCHSEQTSADVRNTAMVTDNVNISNSKNSKFYSILPNSNGKAGGACTSALLDILYHAHNQQQQKSNLHTDSSTISVQSLLLQLRQKLSERGFTQIPQLSSSRPLDVHDDPWNSTTENAGSSKHSSRTITGKVKDGTGGISRALLVGINYTGQYPGELNGCQNDVWNMYKYLVDIEGYSPQNILVLVDTRSSRSTLANNQTQHKPTRATILHALQQLVKQSKPNDTVYFHYSGHGGLLDPNFNDFKKQISSTISSILPSRNRNTNSGDGTITDQYDETIYPVDHKSAGHIRDYSLYKNFVQPMAAGVLVTCVMDCCHSGSVLKLPYTYQPTSGDGVNAIRSITNTEYLSNLAFFYTLMGNPLPIGTGLFENIIANIEEKTGKTLDNYLGNGSDDAAFLNDNGLDPNCMDDVNNYEVANDFDDNRNGAFPTSGIDGDTNNISDSYPSLQQFDPFTNNATDRAYDDTVDPSETGMDCGGCFGGVLAVLLQGNMDVDFDGVDFDNF